jgi:predicted transposase/invertase (TIGR01784 family)
MRLGAIEQGIKQGIKQGIEQTARRMLARGVVIADIADITGLSEADIEAMK